MSRSIDIKCLIPDEDNRKYGGTDAIPSIAEGKEKIYTPILVEKAQKAGLYLIIDGHRRYTSALKAGYETVPCEILTAEEAERAKAITNIDRKELSPLDQLEAIMKLRELGFDNGLIGGMLGISRHQVEKRLRLRNLIDPFMEKLKSGELSIDKASELAIADKEVQGKVYDSNNAITSSMYTLSEVKNAIRTASGIQLFTYTDELLAENGVEGCDCYKCKHNPMSNELFFSNPTKKDSVCSYGSYSCIAQKLIALAKKHRADSICTSNKEIAQKAEEAGVSVSSWSWPRYESLDDSWISYESSIDEDGKLIYQNIKTAERNTESEEDIQRKQRIKSLIAECSECVSGIMDTIIEGYGTKTIPLMPANAKMAILTGKERLPSFRIWDKSLGQDWDDAKKRLGIAAILEGKKIYDEDDLADKNGKIAELIRHIFLDSDIYLMLRRAGQTSTASLVPTEYEVLTGNMRKDLEESLTVFIGYGQHVLGIPVHLWARIYGYKSRYSAAIEELMKISRGK